jgi:hypothetical protein
VEVTTRPGLETVLDAVRRELATFCEVNDCAVSNEGLLLPPDD